MWGRRKKLIPLPNPEAVLSDEERKKFEDERLRLSVDELRKKRGFALWATVIGGIILAIGGVATLAVQAWQHRVEMRELKGNRITENITRLVLALGANDSQERLAAIMALDFYVERDEYKEYYEGLAKVIGGLVNIESDPNVKDNLVSVATKLRRKGEEVTIAMSADVTGIVTELRFQSQHLQQLKAKAVEFKKEVKPMPSKPLPAPPPEPGVPKEAAVAPTKVPKEIEEKIIALGKKGVVGIDLSGQDLSGLDLSRANLKLANLERAILRGIVLEYAILSGARLKDADLAGANLDNADLSGTDLTGARLVGANLANANFKGANLSKADLSNANLMWAKLPGANLSNANLEGVKYFTTLYDDLSGALLEGVKGLSKKDLEFAISHGAIMERRAPYQQAPTKHFQELEDELRR